MIDADFEKMMADHAAAYETLLDLRRAQVQIAHPVLPEGLTLEAKLAAWNSRAKVWPLEDAYPSATKCAARAPLESWDAMTKKQRRTLAILVLRIARGDSMQHDAETMGDYEFKSLEVTRRRGKRGIVCLTTVVGRVGDEDTMAEVFCRTRRHISITWRGGVKLTNAARYVTAKDGTITKKSCAPKTGVSAATIGATS